VAEINEINIQREYYERTASKYDKMHDEDLNSFAREIMFASCRHLGIRSILDVGSGTGSTLLHAKSQDRYSVVGIEPVAELRKIGYARGLSSDELTEGDGRDIKFTNDSFDLVCAFSVLHHVRDPHLVISEMLRVAKIAVFICDSNNFGQGSFLSRGLKQLLNSVGLWPTMNYIKTAGRGYSVTEGDGLSYSYSLFNNYRQISRATKRVHIINVSPAGINPYRTAASVAILAVKN
jgi:ubiquinone/menaquinone biosynthesis C-methylase UbiE